MFEAGGGDPDGKAFGDVTIDTRGNRVSFDLLHIAIGPISAVQIRGPVTPANPLTASAFVMGLEIGATVPAVGHVKGSRSVSHSQAVDMVDQPSLFYMILLTEDFPMGSVVGRLGHGCSA